MSNLVANYSNTVIYKINCKDSNIKDIYIGHSTNFYQRERIHKSNCNNINAKGYNYKIYKIIRENGGWDNWDMLIIEKYSCNNVEEAKERERFWIEKESSSMNITIPNRSKKEYQQIYSMIHKEELTEKAKQYRIKNKEKIKEYVDANKEKIAFQKQDWYEEKKDYVLQKAKEHYIENKEEKLEYQKQYAIENKEKLAKQKKVYRENNKEILQEKQKEYRELHKEELVKLNKEWREKNKEKIKEEKSKIIICECGSSYTFGNKHIHLQTKKHIYFQNNDKKEEEIVKLEISKEIVQEKQKEYRNKNAEKIKIYKKIYNDLHKQENSEQCKKYYQEHKDKILEKTKKYVEENKEKIKKKQSNWYEKNKEKILEKQKQTFICECGAQVRYSGKSEHNRSIKHKIYFEASSQNDLIPLN